MHVPVCVYAHKKENGTCVPGADWEFHFSTEMKQGDKYLEKVI